MAVVGVPDEAQAHLQADADLPGRDLAVALLVRDLPRSGEAAVDAELGAPLELVAPRAPRGADVEGPAADSELGTDPQERPRELDGEPAPGGEEGVEAGVLGRLEGVLGEHVRAAHEADGAAQDGAVAAGEMEANPAAGLLSRRVGALGEIVATAVAPGEDHRRDGGLGDEPVRDAKGVHHRRHAAGQAGGGEEGTEASEPPLVPGRAGRARTHRASSRNPTPVGGRRKGHGPQAASPRAARRAAPAHLLHTRREAAWNTPLEEPARMVEAKPAALYGSGVSTSPAPKKLRLL